MTQSEISEVSVVAHRITSTTAVETPGWCVWQDSLCGAGSVQDYNVLHYLDLFGHLHAPYHGGRRLDIQESTPCPEIPQFLSCSYIQLY